MFKNKKLLLLVTLSLVTIIGLVGWLFLKENADKIDGINYDPPTQSELEETQRHKDDLAEQYQNDSKKDDTSDGSSKKSVKPFITFGAQNSSTLHFELNGYVPGIVENNGTCILTLTKGSLKVTQEKVALSNVQDTTCGRIVIERNRLEPGTWRVNLSYESPSSSGVSDALTADIK